MNNKDLMVRGAFAETPRNSVIKLLEALETASIM
jgi:hypothetical protein